MQSPRTHIHVLIASALALLPACSKEAPAPSPSSSGASSAQAGLPDRDPALARRLVASGGVLLDVRTTEEHAARHLDGAVNIPVNDLKSRLPEIEKLAGGDKKKPIVVHCQSGSRSQRAKEMLTAEGYEQVTNLGGIDDWDRK